MSTQTINLNPIETIATKKQPTQRTLNRRSYNKAVQCEIMNFSDVFKHVRKKYFILPNRVTLRHIQESEVYIKDLLLQYCSENLAEKAKDNFYLDRLPLLTTDIKALRCFMTKKQLETFTEKAWNFSSIMDILVKALTMPNQNYLSCLAQKNKI